MTVYEVTMDYHKSELRQKDRKKKHAFKKVIANSEDNKGTIIVRFSGLEAAFKYLL